MKIQTINDLHFGAMPNMDDYLTDADVVSVAGDVVTSGETDLVLAFLEQFALRGQRVVFVPGNHELYGGLFNDKLEALRVGCEKVGAEFLHNGVFEHEGTRFLGTTLWTDFCYEGEGYRDLAMSHAMQNVADFSWIFQGKGQTLRPLTTTEWHREALRFLTAEIDRGYEGKTVIITHHAPTSAAVSPYWRGQLSNGAFASRLEYLVDCAGIALWHHGHTHMKYEAEIYGTRFVCNPRGYRSEGGTGFDPKMIVDI